MDEITILNQLSRMRSMNKYYHDQFLFDVSFILFYNDFSLLSINK